MDKQLDRVGYQLRRLFILIVPLSYYLLSRKSLLLLNASLLFIVLFIMYMKHYLQVKMRPKFLNTIFVPEAKLAYLVAACFLTIFLFSKMLAMNMLLFIIVGNTLADIAKQRYGRTAEMLAFMYVCLFCSLFILFFPFMFDWHIAMLSCLAAAVVRRLKFSVNQDISVALSSGLVMRLLLA